MSLHRLECECWVPAPIDQVWAFGTDAKNLVKLTPAIYGLKVESDGPTRNGLKMRITMAPMGIAIPKSWIAVISEVKDSGPERSFTDTEETGPFRYWKHVHGFRADAVQGTWIKDTVEYELPFEIAGEAAHFIFARKNLESLFGYRRKVCREIFGVTPQ